MKAPNKCPMCGERSSWIQVDVTKKGFSVGKAVTGTFLLGPLVGALNGARGKKKHYYACKKCGFEHEYD